MRTKKLMGMLLSLALIVTLCYSIPAHAGVTVTIPATENSDEVPTPNYERFGLEEDGFTGVGLFVENPNSDVLSITDDFLDLEDAEYDTYINNSISEFTDEVDFVTLNPSYTYTLSYTSKGEVIEEELDKETLKWKIPSKKLTPTDVTITMDADNKLFEDYYASKESSEI